MCNVRHTVHMPARFRAVAPRLRGVFALIAVLAVIGAGLVATPTVAVAAGVAAAPVQSAAQVPSGPLVQAADLSKFDAGNIISDAVFFDSGTMTEAQIQSFLESKVGSCQSGYTCLKDWYDTSRVTGADAMCGAYPGGMRERASAIIAKVAKACGINPQVILATLQKEQGLVTHTWPSDWRYTIAMGQGCPDTAACDTRYYGFFNQVYGAAWQFKRYANPAGTSQYFTWYAPGKTWNVQYNPNAGCGSSPVNIRNQATANLYYYTPYQPNAAALRAGYGEGDGCSSYGNRNFFNYFTDWFGSTQTSAASRSPFGGYDLVIEKGQFTVRGWALDPDQPSAQLAVSLTVNGQEKWATFVADSPRPDVGTAYPGYGDSHGMNSTFPVEGGDYQVCVDVRNVGAGADTRFGCSQISVETASPHGGVTFEPVGGGVRVTGWTLDTDTKDPIDVHIYVDGRGSAHRADASRPDVGQVFPGYGDDHGIDVTLPTSVGVHEVCAYGINVGRGSNKLLGCQQVEVSQSADPIGVMDAPVAVPGGYRVSGWAYDPNTSEPINVHVYGDGAPRAVLRADRRRDGIDAKYGVSGLNHGYDTTISAPAGQRAVCAYGINVGWGTNNTLGCSSVTVLSGAPFGGIDTAIVEGKVRLRGWSIDPDTTASTDVHVYIDGVPRVIRADASRPDVGAAYPGYGGNHGIDSTFDVSPGRHTVCAYGINVGSGENALLGCSDVTVPSRAPFGGTDVTVSGQAIRLGGWAIDPDTTSDLAVHVYVDGQPRAVVRANALRPDVGAAYPGYGDNHGIDVQLSLSPGVRQICSYGINEGPGENSLLACQTVVIAG